jgi:hypothetical protein
MLCNQQRTQDSSEEERRGAMTEAQEKEVIRKPDPYRMSSKSKLLVPLVVAGVNGQVNTFLDPFPIRFLKSVIHATNGIIIDPR